LTSHGAGPLIKSEAAEFNDVAAFDGAIKAFALQIRKIHEKTKDYDRETLRKRKNVI
jgi:ribosome-associated translation inhibitor RaiA